MGDQVWPEPLHETVTELAQTHGSRHQRPSDLEHPCQILADLLTMIEFKKSVKDLKAPSSATANNVAHSLALGVSLLGGSFNRHAERFRDEERNFGKSGVVR